MSTAAWCVQVKRVKGKDVCVPENLQRAMAAEAEAVLEARAKVIAAVEVIIGSPAAQQVCLGYMVICSQHLYCNLYCNLNIEIQG